MLWALIILPLLGGFGALFSRQTRWLRALLLAAAVLHGAMLAVAWQNRAAFAGYWLALDDLALLFIGVTDILFLAAVIYSTAYLNETPAHRHDLFSRESTFIAMLLFFFAMMSLAILSQHCLLTWVAIEATTLVTAALICYHRNARALEAAWKYMLICSVGIALALAGCLALATAATFAATDGAPDLTYRSLLALAPSMQPGWLKIAFSLLLVGYGTKIGFFPMHTWLPDAHSEAPAPVSALLSAALLNCALVALLRIFAVANVAGLGDFAGEMLRAFAIASIAVAVIFIARQDDYKRLLAYSSVEHLGIVALGMSYAFARDAAALHALNHSLVKCWLFLTAGNLLTHYRTKHIVGVKNLAARAPVLAVLWLLGLFAICGFPPFGIFVSEFWLLQKLFAQDENFTAIILMLMLALVLIGMSRAFITMTLKSAPDTTREIPPFAPLPYRRIVPVFGLAALSLLLGVWLPAPLRETLAAAAQIISGK